MLTLLLPMITTENEKYSTVILESACAFHVSNDSFDFYSFALSDGIIYVSSTAIAPLFGSGLVKAETIVNFARRTVPLNTVFFILDWILTWFWFQ